MGDMSKPHDGAAALVLASRRVAMRHALDKLALRNANLPEPVRQAAADAMQAGGDVLDSPNASGLDWAQAEFLVRQALRDTVAT